jgi:hypothetical protein
MADLLDALLEAQTFLNVAFLALASALAWRFLRTGELPLLPTMNKPAAEHADAHAHWEVQVRRRNPASVTVTSRRTAALDGRLLAAASAWRQ